MTIYSQSLPLPKDMFRLEKFFLFFVSSFYLAVTNEQSVSLSLFQKVTKFVGSFWPSSSKENNPLDINTTTNDKNNRAQLHSPASKSRNSRVRGVYYRANSKKG